MTGSRLEMPDGCLNDRHAAITQCALVDSAKEVPDRVWKTHAVSEEVRR